MKKMSLKITLIALTVISSVSFCFAMPGLNQPLQGAEGQHLQRVLEARPIEIMARVQDDEQGHVVSIEARLTNVNLTIDNMNVNPYRPGCIVSISFFDDNSILIRTINIRPTDQVTDEIVHNDTEDIFERAKFFQVASYPFDYPRNPIYYTSELKILEPLQEVDIFNTHRFGEPPHHPQR